MQSQCESLLVARSPDPRRPFRSDPIFLASPLPSHTLPFLPSEIKASEKETIPDPYFWSCWTRPRICPIIATILIY